MSVQNSQQPTIEQINEFHSDLEKLSKSDGIWNGFLVTNEYGKLARINAGKYASHFVLSKEEKIVEEKKLQNAVSSYIQINQEFISSKEDIAMLRNLMRRVGLLGDKNITALIDKKAEFIQIKDKASGLIKKIISAAHAGKSDELRNSQGKFYDLVTTGKGDIRQALRELAQEKKISKQDLNCIISEEMILNDTDLQILYDDLFSEITLAVSDQVQKQATGIVDKILKYAKTNNIPKLENAQREFFLLSVGNEQNITQTLKELSMKGVVDENNLKHIIHPELIIMNPQFEKIHSEVSSEITRAAKLFKDQRFSIIKEIASHAKAGKIDELENAKRKLADLTIENFHLTIGNIQNYSQILKELAWDKEISADDLKHIIDPGLVSLKPEIGEVHQEVLVEIQTVASITKILDAAKADKGSELDKAKREFVSKALRNEQRISLTLKELAQRGGITEANLKQIIDPGLIMIWPQFSQIEKEVLPIIGTVVQKQTVSIINEILNHIKNKNMTELKKAQQILHDLTINNRQIVTQSLKELARHKIINDDNFIFNPGPEIDEMHKEVLSEIQTVASITKILDAVKAGKSSELENVKNEFFSKFVGNEQRISQILKDFAQRGLISESDLNHIIDPQLITSRQLLKDFTQRGAIKKSDLKNMINSESTELEKQSKQIHLEVMHEIALAVKKQTVSIVNKILEHTHTTNTELGKAQREFFLLSLENKKGITQALKELAVAGIISENNLKYIIHPEMMIMMPQFEQIYQEVLLAMPERHGSG